VDVKLSNPELTREKLHPKKSQLFSLMANRLSSALFFLSTSDKCKQTKSVIKHMFSWQPAANIVKRQQGLKAHRTFRTVHALWRSLYSHAIYFIHILYTVKNGDIIPGFSVESPS
jgi:hypothetical protein